MSRTARTAANKLPEKAQKPFLRAWRATGCMDLYGGRLSEYLQVIAQRLEEKTEQVKYWREMIDDTRRMFARVLKSK